MRKVSISIMGQGLGSFSEPCELEWTSGLQVSSLALVKVPPYHVGVIGANLSWQF